MGLDVYLRSIKNDDLCEPTVSFNVRYEGWDYCDLDSDKMSEVVYYRRQYDICQLFSKVLSRNDQTSDLIYYEVPKRALEKIIALIDSDDGSNDYLDLKEILQTCLNTHNFETHTLLFYWCG